jgi:hypothetical protein
MLQILYMQMPIRYWTIHGEGDFKALRPPKITHG